MLLVEHSQPLDELDSGWGFYCGADGHEDAELRITDLERFRNLDPDLPHLLDTVPQGNIAWRSSEDMPWVVEPTGDESSGEPPPKTLPQE